MNIGPKIEILNFELGEKLDGHFCVKFYGKSNGDSLEAQKPCLSPKKALIVHYWSKNRNYKLCITIPLSVVGLCEPMYTYNK